MERAWRLNLTEAMYAKGYDLPCGSWLSSMPFTVPVCFLINSGEQVGPRLQAPPVVMGQVGN